MSTDIPLNNNETKQRLYLCNRRLRRFAFYIVEHDRSVPSKNHV
jgi:hypothetical protein